MNQGRTLVVYYSLSGNTERVAKDLAGALGADLEAIVDRQKRNGFLGHLRSGYEALARKSSPIEQPRKALSDYAVILIGTPVWFGNLTPAVRSYLKLAKGQIRDADVVLFATSGRTDVEHIVPSAETALGEDVIAYAGFNARELYNENVYSRKLADFIRTIKDRTPLGSMRAVVV